jgi:hypothetical protein
MDAIVAAVIDRNHCPSNDSEMILDVMPVAGAGMHAGAVQFRHIAPFG